MQPLGSDPPSSPIEAQLHAWAAEFATQHDLLDRTLRITPPLLDEEADGLALAMSTRLIDVKTTGQFRMVGAAGSKGPYNLFSRGPRPALNREYLIQVVAFAELVLDHGWAARSVAFEHDALDIATFDSQGHIVVAAEAKRDAPLLARMLHEMAVATPESMNAAKTNSARKLASLTRLRPQVFLAVSPGIRRAFDVDFDGQVPRLVPRDDIPKGGRGPYACRVCGSEEDVRGESERDGVIPLHCDACGYQWSRVPRRPCPRCGSKDVDMSGYEGWSYEDLDAARDAEFHDAAWHTVDWDVYRCRHCRNVWQIGHRSA